MLRFISFLTEDRIDFLKEKNPVIDTSHDPDAEHKDSASIIDHFAQKADPTRNKAHTPWIINQYKKKSVKQEDFPRIHDALSDFDRYKGKLTKKDINQYKSLDEIEDAVKPHLGSSTSKKEEKKQQRIEGADVIHDSDNYSVLKLKTKEAAKQYGKGTRWCTSAKEDCDNRFDYYNEQGPLYVIRNKKTGERRQFHFESNQFKDEADQEINLPHYIHQNPEIGQIPEFETKSKETGRRPYIFGDPEKIRKQIDDEFDQANVKTDMVRSPHISHTLLTKVLNSGHGHLASLAIQNPTITDDEMTKALYGDYPNLNKMDTIKNPNIKPKHIDIAMGIDPKTAITHPQISQSSFDFAMRSGNPEIMEAGFENKDKVKPEHIDLALENNTPLVRSSAVDCSDLLTPKHIDKFLNDRYTRIRKRAILSPNASSENISKALSDPDSEVTEAAISHPSVNSEHIDLALSPLVSKLTKAKAAGHKSATEAQIWKALSSKERDVRAAAASNPNATYEQLSKAVEDPDSEVKWAAVQHPKVTQELINKAIKTGDPNMRFLRNL